MPPASAVEPSGVTRVPDGEGCVCLGLFLALPLCGQGQAGLQEPSALGLPCPCGACHRAGESVQAPSWPSWPLLAGSWRRTGVT